MRPAVYTAPIAFMVGLIPLTQAHGREHVEATLHVGLVLVDECEAHPRPGRAAPQVNCSASTPYMVDASRPPGTTRKADPPASQAGKVATDPQRVTITF